MLIVCSFVCPGLQILFTLLQNITQEETAAQSFYQTYFCDILQHILSVVTDTSHTAGQSLYRVTHTLWNLDKLKIYNKRHPSVR